MRIIVANVLALLAAVTCAWLLYRVTAPEDERPVPRGAHRAPGWWS